MKNRIQSFFLKIVVISGYFFYFFHLKKITFLFFSAIVLLLMVFVADMVYRRFYWKLLLPFSSGLLCFLARLFYWDQFDWIQRVNNLLLISIIFTLILGWHQFKLGKKGLFFFNRLKLKKRLLVIFVFSEIVFIIASFFIVQKGIGLVGDEAHYLVISQSIARDFDLNVFNQYARDEYKEFINQHLQSHAKVGKGFKKWYSFHLPGLSFTLVPFLFFKLPVPLLYFLIRSYLGLFAALIAVLVYMFSLRIWKKENMALLIAIVFCFSSPVFFMSIHIFAEVQVLLLILFSLYLLLFVRRKSNFSILLAGFLLSITIFWGMKYVIFIYGLGIGFLIYFIINKDFKRAILFILFPIFFQLVFFSYLNFAYGNFSPMSIYTGVMSESQTREYFQNVKSISFKSRVETLLDYFFDQRDGLLLYSPFYFFFFPGLIIALRKFKTYLPHLLISIASFVYLFYHGFSTVRAGVCPQARYMVPILWTVMLFCIIYYLETRNRFLKKLFWRIPLYSFLVIAYQVFNPYTLYQTTTHDYLYRPGLIFQKWSNIYINVSQLLPSFIKTVPSSIPPYTKPSANESYLPNIIALLIVLILIGVSLIPFKQIKVHWLLSVFFIIAFVLFGLFPRAPLYNPILVTKTGTIPHLVHGVSSYPRKIQEKRFEIREQGNFRYLISTREKADFFIIESENPESTDISAEFFYFDHKVPDLNLFSSGSHKGVIKEPGYFKRQHRYFYQFTVRIKKYRFKKKPLILQLYPVKRWNKSEF
ncbi:MAG: hypothetical protein KAT17_03795 [Candidatus Aminicenantes bacterium]|nr:hypothetical protein [Candidatus Aminicenantes bacterium]